MSPPPIRRLPMPVRILLLLAVLAAVAAGVFAAVKAFRGVPGDSIRASGTIEARTTEIASEVAGTVM